MLFVLFYGYTTRDKEENPYGKHLKVYDHLSVLRGHADNRRANRSHALS